MAGNGILPSPSPLALRPPHLRVPSFKSQASSSGSIERANLIQWLQAREANQGDEGCARSLDGCEGDSDIWLCDTEEYRRWHTSKSQSTLWVEYLPGRDSSTLAETVTQLLRKNEQAPVLTFLCREALEDRVDPPTSLTRDWIAQLLPHCPVLEIILRPLARIPLDAVPHDIFWECLLEALSSLERVYCVIDSLHDVPESELHHLVRRLSELATFQPHQVKLLFTGQRRDGLNGLLETSSSFMIRVELNGRLRTPTDELGSPGPEKTFNVLRSMLYGRELAEFLRSIGPRSNGHPDPNPAPFGLSLGSNLLTPRLLRRYGTEMVRAQLMRVLLMRGIHAPGTRQSVVHSLFEHVNCSVACLEVFFEFTNDIDVKQFNKRDPYSGRTIIQAACAMRILDATYLLPGNAHLTPAEIWYRATGLFLRMPGHGADVSAVDRQGRNVLHILLANPEMSEDHILAFLRRPEAKPLATAKDKSGLTPLHYGMRNLRPASCEALLGLGADILQKDVDGTTVLHHIATQWLCLLPEHRSGTIPERKTKTESHLSTVLGLWRKFIFLGGSINAQDVKGNPPLLAYLASSGPRLTDLFHYKNGGTSRHLEYFDLFFDAYNADLTLRNNTGQTALHIIAARKDSDAGSEEVGHDSALFSFLLDRGVDLAARDIDGKTSVDVAKKLGKVKILGLLEDDAESVD